MSSPPPPPAPVPAPPDGPPRRARPEPRRLAAVVAVGIALAAASVGVASLLNEPTGASDRDSAQAQVGGDVAGLTPTTGTSPGGGTSTTGEVELPPFSTVLERTLPEGLSEVPAGQAVTRLRERVAESRTARRLVELAVGYQRLGRPREAAPLFAEAIRDEPGNVAALVGAAMTPPVEGEAGLDAAQRDLAALRKRFPRNQLVVFNVAWTGLYRRDAAVALPALEQVVRLDPNSFLASAASGLLNAAGRGG